MTLGGRAESREDDTTARVVVKESVVLGEPLPQKSVVQQIPDNPNDRYAPVNGRRVIIEPSSHRLVAGYRLILALPERLDSATTEMRTSGRGYAEVRNRR